MNIEEIIQRSVRDAVEKEIESILESAQADLRGRVRRKTAEIAATVCSKMSMEMYGKNEMRITVQFDETPKR
jgi:hypothetical protein